MTTISAIYVRMNTLMSELGGLTDMLYKELVRLREALEPLGISWEGSAEDVYMQRLMKGLLQMEMTSIEIRIIHNLLYEALTSYQKTESNIERIIGGLR